MRRRLLRLAATLVVTGLCLAYIVWKVDIGRTAPILVHANVWHLLGRDPITVGTVWPMPWRSQRPLLARTAPLLRFLRVERPVRAVYEGLHSYRDNVGLMLGVFVLTLAVQIVRVLAIWMCGKAVGVDLSPKPYYVMGPLFFL